SQGRQRGHGGARHVGVGGVAARVAPLHPVVVGRTGCQPGVLVIRRVDAELGQLGEGGAIRGVLQDERRLIAAVVRPAHVDLPRRGKGGQVGGRRGWIGRCGGGGRSRRRRVPARVGGLHPVGVGRGGGERRFGEAGDAGARR